MRRRALTTKILALALGAIPACTKPDVQRDVPASTGSAPIATSSAQASAPPDAAAIEDPKLVALREDLANAKRADALSNVARFRPLCDKDGYPLVGNLMRKMPDPGLEPSELCAEIRKKK